MEIDKIIELVRELNITDEDDFTFRSAVCLLYGLSHETVSAQKIKRGTGYYRREVEIIVHNFWANGVIQDYCYCFENTQDKPAEFFIELVLCAMAGSGDIIRKSVDGIPFDKDREPISRLQLIKAGTMAA